MKYDLVHFANEIMACVSLTQIKFSSTLTPFSTLFLFYFYLLFLILPPNVWKIAAKEKETETERLNGVKVAGTLILTMVHMSLSH